MNQRLKDATELYELILEGANYFLRNVRAFEIHVLQNHDPTYKEIAEALGGIVALIDALADEFDPMLAQKANDYVYLMRKMAIAIANDDNVSLSDLVEELDAKPFL